MSSSREVVDRAEASLTTPASSSNARKPLRQLAPKAKHPYNTTGGVRILPGRPAAKLCPVPGCRTVVCQLKSHKHFAAAKSGTTPLGSDIARSTCDDDPFKHSYAYRLAQTFVDRDPAASRVDPFYNLPISANINTPEMHALFHDCEQT